MPPNGGGGIFSDEDGVLRLINSIVSGNFGIIGGGIGNAGMTTCNDSTLSINGALSGSGLANMGGEITISNCTVQGNSIFLLPDDVFSSGLPEDSFPLGFGGGIFNVSAEFFGEESGAVSKVVLNYSEVKENGGLFGSGIANLGGEVTLNNSTVSDNSALPPEGWSPDDEFPPGFGGGILNIIGGIGDGTPGVLTLNDSTVRDNNAVFGGGICNGLFIPEAGEEIPGGAVILTDSTISGNTAMMGGGLLNSQEGIVTVGSSTISGNSVYLPDGVVDPNDFPPAFGGGFLNFGEGALTNSTVTDNTADDGGGIFTHALFADSPAIDAGSCTDIEGNLVSKDQRGESRPYLSGGNCDIGAYEYPSLDGTDVPPDVQDAGPNNGDGNGDGIPDSRQRTVASLPSATTGESYLTVEITGCAQIENVQAYTYESVGAGDSGYNYPFGLVGFEIPCSPVTVRIYYHGALNLDGYIYRKYGPTPADWNASLWYTMPGVTFGTKVIGGETVSYVQFALTDGLIGDDTGMDGIIYDQGGPATPSSAIPTLSEWGMIILFLLTITAAFTVIRRRRS